MALWKIDNRGTWLKLGLILGAYLAVFIAVVVFGLIRYLGQVAGVVPVPTPARAAADLSSGNLARQTQALRDLQKLTPSREDRSVAQGLRVLIQDRFRRGHARNEAIKALGDWGDASDADVLAPILGDAHWAGAEDRRDAAVALGKLGGPRAAELLVEALKTDADRDTIVAALGNLGGTAEGRTQMEPHLLKVFPDEQVPERGRVAAAALLQQFGGPQSLELLEQFEEEDGAIGKAARTACTALRVRKE